MLSQGWRRLSAMALRAARIAHGEARATRWAAAAVSSAGATTLLKGGLPPWRPSWMSAPWMSAPWTSPHRPRAHRLLCRLGLRRHARCIEVVDLIDKLVGEGTRDVEVAGQQMLRLHELGDALPLGGEIFSPLDAGRHLVAAETRTEDDARLLHGGRLVAVGLGGRIEFPVNLDGLLRVRQPKDGGLGDAAQHLGRDLLVVGQEVLMRDDDI